jgi:hypothetical protein
VFIGIQIRQQDGATVPPRILKQRGILTASWSAFSLSDSFLAVVYLVSFVFTPISSSTHSKSPQLPIYFQAIKGVSAVKSGIDNLLMILSPLWEYYAPFMILASIFTAVGAGLLSTHRECWSCALDRVPGHIRLGLGRRNPAAHQRSPENPRIAGGHHRRLAHPLYADSRSVLLQTAPARLISMYRSLCIRFREPERLQKLAGLRSG